MSWKQELKRGVTTGWGAYLRKFLPNFTTTAVVLYLQPVFFDKHFFTVIIVNTIIFYCVNEWVERKYHGLEKDTTGS